MKAPTPPEAAIKAGMTSLVFHDDFDSPSTIDMNATGNAGFKWYVDKPAFNESSFTDSDYELKDSVLTLKQQLGGYGLSSYSRKGKTGFIYRFGYAEIRARFQVTDIPEFDEEKRLIKGSKRMYWPNFWAHSLKDYLGQPWEHAGELDIFEAIAPNRNKQAIPIDEKNEDIIAWNAVGGRVMYTGCLHDHWKQPDGTKRLGTNCVNATGYNNNLVIVDEGWHTYAALWDLGTIEWYMDGKKMHSVRYSKDELPEYYYRDSEEPLPRIEAARPELASRTWKGSQSIMDEEETILLIGSDAQWPMEVDWVRVWQKEDNQSVPPRP